MGNTSEEIYSLVDNLLNAKEYAKMIETSGYASINWASKYYFKDSINNYDNGIELNISNNTQVLYDKYQNFIK